jgi:hypothetical protein
MSKPVYADDTKAYDIVSYGTVIAQITLDSIHSYHSTDRKNQFIRQSIKLGMTVGGSELVKRIVHKDRPDGSDDKSFWSEHTGLACTSESHNFYIGIPISTMTAIGRMKAKKHDIVDVLSGCGFGILAERLASHVR